MKLFTTLFIILLSFLVSAQEAGQGTPVPEIVASAAVVKKAPPIQVTFEVERFNLPNGLTALLYEDHSVPLVSYHTWFRVGSKNEKQGTTGIAHLFEHLMFKGAKRYDGKSFDRVLDAIGGVNNAFTSRDYTGYYINLPSSKLELAMDLESDRMENLQVTEENLKSEREVVKEERRMRVENDTVGAMLESMYSLLFKVHPYGWPVIGTMDDINRISLEDCKKFFKTYYSPNNAVIVIAGDFKKDQAKTLLQKYYGHLVPQTIPKLELPKEPVQGTERLLTLNKDVKGDYVAISFRAAKAGDPDYYALDLAANILGEGESSRLFRRLIYQLQLATSVSVSNYSFQEPGVFQVITVLKPGVDREKVLKIIYEEIWKLRNSLVNEWELSKIRNQVMKSYIDSLKTVEGKASSLAFNEIVLGNYQSFFKDLDKYNSVTSEQIKKTSEKFLNPWQRSVVAVTAKAKPDVKVETTAKPPEAKPEIKPGAKQ